VTMTGVDALKTLSFVIGAPATLDLTPRPDFAL
jgi:hypothetical protein